jgi:Phosphotransferase enzyme family
MSQALPHDLALPQLAQALDGQAMAAVFAASLHHVQVTACQVDRVKYRPGRNASVSYRLTLREPSSGRSFEQGVAARFFSDGQSARRASPNISHDVVASAAGPTVTHDAGLDMVAHWQPNDAKLDALRVLADPMAMRERSLDEVVAALTNGQGQAVSHSTQWVQVVPERRVCARVTLQLKRSTNAPVTTEVLYAKADIDNIGETTHAVMQALSNSKPQQQGLLHTPTSLLWQRSTGLHWQRAVMGQALLAVDPAVGPATSARLGAQLAALHATRTPASRSITADSLCAQVQAAAALLAKVEPAWQLRLDRLTRYLNAGAALLAREPQVQLHGDLHPGNVIVNDDHLVLVDWDSARVGPAVIELGAWVGDAMHRAILNQATPQSAAPAWRALVAAYAQHTQRAPDMALLAWSTAHHLLCQRACRGVVNLKPGRFEAVPQLLSLAEAIARARSVGSEPVNHQVLA